MYYFIVLVVVVLIVIWYYCYIRNSFRDILNKVFPPCDGAKVQVSIPIQLEEFKDDISKHITFTENNLHANLY